MATIPPFRKIAGIRVRDALEWAQRGWKHEVPYDANEKACAIWMRGNDMAIETLTSLILARIEARAMLPDPGTPHDMAVAYGRDREAKAIISILTKIHQAPLEFGSGEDEDA